MNEAACSSSPKAIVVSCSGAADVGEIADLAARKLNRLGLARMGCLAGITAHDEEQEGVAKSAPIVVVLDGCPHGCGAEGLKAAGLKDCLHIKLSDFGLEAGKAQVSEMFVNQVVDRVAILLRERGLVATAQA